MKWAPQVSNLRPLPCEPDSGVSGPVAPVRTGSHARGNTALAFAPIQPGEPDATPAYRDRTAPVPRPLLTVRDVATALQVSTATVYAIVERGELAHLRVSNSIRISPDELERYLARARA
jgi:excisionase family DNA binding protein